MSLRYTVNVLQALGRHLGVPARELSLAHDLRRDWGLTPLSLVLVLLELERRVGIELPAHELAEVRTVSDLVVRFRRWVGDNEQRVASHVPERARSVRRLQSERRLRRELHRLRWLEQSRALSR